MSNVKAKMDIIKVAIPDKSVDMVICSHVLEHVVDHIDALGELFRVMKKDGWELVIVPISAETTIEDSSVTDPKERLALYGQFDHVRRYGSDVQERLESVGFGVEKTMEKQVVRPEQASRYAVGDTPMFICRKQ